MTGGRSSSRPAWPSWRQAWPCWALLAFAGLGVAILLPGGYARAILAVPVMLTVPGSLTLGALFGPRYRLPETVFACFTALLSVAWWMFASLILYASGVLITTVSTYGALLGICALLAAGAQARLWRAGPGRAGAPAATGTRYYALAAGLAGVSLLVGGVFTWDHIHHPAPAGYTWLAWTGPPHYGAISTGPAGRTLPFEIVHRQHTTGTFQVQAVWQTSPPRPLAKPMTVRIGPEQTFRGALFVPRVPNGCSYRVVVTVTGAGRLDPLTRLPPSWSINATVHGPDLPARPALAPEKCQL